MIASELRYALRSFRREPAFTAGVLLNFALAIGATAAMFGLVNRLLFASPPGIHEADRVVRVELTFHVEGGESYTVSTTSYPVYRAVAANRQAFEAVAAARADTVTTGRGTELEQVAVVQATGNYFSTLGVRPTLGRLFGPLDDELPAGNDVVVLGHAYWQRKFAADPRIIGTDLVVDGQVLTIIGVAPRDFNGTELAATDLFVPLSTAFRTRGDGWWSNAGLNAVGIVARLAPSVSPLAAGEQAERAVREATMGYSRENDTGVQLRPLTGGSPRVTTQARIALWAAGVAVVVLLIATANAGTLFLLRAARRRAESAVRLSLGARIGVLLRQSLVEGLLLATAGASLGLLLSRWFGDAIRITLLPGLAPVDGIVDQRVLVASIAAALAAGMLAGLSPLAQLRRRNLPLDLRAGASHGSSRRFVMQHLLVAIQVALCTVLLVGAGLFVRSMRRVQAQDLGFSTARLLYVTLDFRGSLSPAERDLAYQEAVRRVTAVPGVTDATVTQGMPFASHHIPPVNIPGYELPPPNVQQLPILYAATPTYLEMMGVVLREGRLFTDQDARNAPLVVLVNETMAREAWPGQSAIGKCVRSGLVLIDGIDPLAAAATLPCREVVGVVRDSRARSLRTEGGEARLMQYYVPFAQVPSVVNQPEVHAMLVRVTGEPERFVSPVQRIIQGTSAVPVYARVRPYQELIDPQLRSWRLGATLFSLFGLVALGIAAVGLFAVVSYLVSQRTQEIGVRVALGGSAASVSLLVLRDAVRMAGLGVAAGTLVTLVGAPAVQSMLFETSARDAASVITAAGLLLVVTVVAAALPARRASRVSPMTALRNS